MKILLHMFFSRWPRVGRNSETYLATQCVCLTMSTRHPISGECPRQRKTTSSSNTTCWGGQSNPQPPTCSPWWEFTRPSFLFYEIHNVASLMKRYCIKYSSRCMYYVPIELSELLQHWSLILEVHIKMLITHFKAKHELFLYSSLSWLNHNVLYFHLHMSPIVH